MTTYSGNIVELIPEKAAYSKGELVRVKVHFTASKSAGFELFLAWHARVRVFVGSSLMDEDETTFFPSSWAAQYVDHTTRYLNLGAMPASNMTGRVDILCGG